jgi:hypothetical protein
MRTLAALALLGCSSEPSPEASPSTDSAIAETSTSDTSVTTDTSDTMTIDSSIDTVETSPPPLLADDFEAHTPSVAWVDDSTHGVWRARYSGFGQTAIDKDGTQVLREKPQASTKLDETHASLVLSTTTINVDFDLTLRMKTVAQLRTPTPNAWEVAWVAWHYRDEGHFYYFAPKPNGWELGKVDNSKVDPSGPDCVWPAYMNCKYPGAQRYLATGSSPTFPIGAWYRVRVTQVGATMTITVDDKMVTSFTDKETPYSSGAIGLYNEDAHVEFDDVLVRAR